MQKHYNNNNQVFGFAMIFIIAVMIAFNQVVMIPMGIDLLLELKFLVLGLF